MPSVFSRLTPYLTPQCVLLLISSYLALRLARRLLVSAAVSRRLAKAQSEKKALRERDMAKLEEAVATTKEEREGKEQEIVTASATQIVQKIKEGTYSSRVVLHTLLARVARAQAHFNLLSETNFAQAIEDAEKADQQLQSSAGSVGRLHGLPISVKDSLNLTGLDTTLGLVRYTNQPAPADALIVQLMKKQGAIFYVKSNIPQTLLSFECSNPLHGRSLHPMNVKLTPGGSSGGESGLLVAGASVLGVGTDIGGSVRIPAHFCGHSALKPTARRISLQGFRPSVPGQEGVPAVAGPMAHYTEDLALMMREILVPEAWERDHDLVPLPFDDKEYNNNEKLKVGYYVDDGFVPASPACARAVLEAADALRKAGHTVVEFQPKRMLDGIALYFGLMTADNADTLGNQLEGEQWEDYCKTMMAGVHMPKPIRAALVALVKNVLRDRKAATFAAAAGEKSVAKVWNLQYERKKFRQEFFDAWKAAGNFDVLLTPVHVLPAVAHRSFQKISFTCSYTAVYNLLDLPSGVLPITYVDKEKDAYVQPAGSLLERAARSCYNLEEQHGLPLGVQVVGLPFKDETVLRAMRIMEPIVKFKRPEVNLQ